MLIILLSITVMFDALFVLLTQPSTLLAIVTEALQRSQRSADTLRGTARTREKRWTRWGTLYKGRPRSCRSPCTIKWRGSPQGRGRVAVSVTATTLVYAGRAGGTYYTQKQTTSFSLHSCGKNWQSCKIKSGSGLEMRLCMSQFDKST